MILQLLEQDGFTLKKVANTGGGEYAGSCPFCSGTDRFRVWPSGKGHYWCRGCGAKGDAIQYLRDYRKMTFKDASSLTGKTTTATARRPERPPAWAPETPTPPSAAWQERASFLALQYAAILWGSAGNKMRSWLRNEKGLNDETIRNAGLGYVPADLFEPRASWGLPEGNKICVPAGLCIPVAQDGKFIRLRVRRRYPSDNGDRYSVVSGSSMVPMILENPQTKVAVVVESELDAILIDQDAGDLCTVIAMGSAQAKPDSRTDRILNSAEIILLSLDTDEAGAKAAWDFWSKQYGRKVKRWPCLLGKDPSDSWKNGLDLRQWIQAGLPIIPPEENKCLVVNHDAPESSLQGKETPPPIDADDQELIDWFMSAELPQEPFDLDCARRVTDPKKFFNALRREVAGRQSSPRWKCAATQADIRRLKEINSLNNKDV